VRQRSSESGSSAAGGTLADAGQFPLLFGTGACVAAVAAVGAFVARRRFDRATT
jgi:hypothetical protein